VAPGDNISEQQPIVEVDTEKAAIDVPSSAAGKVKNILVKQGDVVAVGQALLTLEEAGQPVKPEEKPISHNGQPASSPAETPKPSPVEAPPITTPIPHDDVQEASEPAGAPQVSEPEIAAASPSLRRMARELGIDINEVTGTGPDGRITEDNVRNYARSIILNASSSPKEFSPASPPDFSRWGEIERKPMTGVRRATAQHVESAWAIPHVTHFDSADITELEDLRKRFAGRMENSGGRLTITAIALKTAAAALKRFPQCNAAFDATQEEIIFRKYVHISVAVDTARGLLTPVIRDVDKKNIEQLAHELAEAAENARKGVLRMEDMQGGTFTITNLGGIGGTNFTPIINSPEAAILGLSRANLQAVYKDGQFVPRLILPLALSFDHRIIDGADAARFLRWFAEALETPFMLALEG
jgi:pyruvate dehydrogenase E2 component (dihydrolipoamide acetyltransferase)